MADVPAQTRTAGESTSFIAALRRRIWIPILCAGVAAVGTVLLVGLRPAQYEATALLQVNQPDIDQLITTGLTEPLASEDAAQGGLPSDLAVNEIAAEVRSYRNAQRAVEFLQLHPFISPNQVVAATTVAVDQRTGLIDVTARAAEPREAARIATALARGYVNIRRHEQIEQLSRTRRRLEHLAQVHAGSSLSSTEDLKSLTDAVVRLRLAADLQPLGVLLLRPAVPPAGTAGGSVSLLGLIAGSLGLLVGIGLIGVSELSDRRIRSILGLERSLGAPVLCQLRGGRSPSRGSQPPDRTQGDAPFRLLLARLRHELGLEPGQFVVVASVDTVSDAETVATGLAGAAAASGLTTLLVDAATHAPRVRQRRFALPTGEEAFAAPTPDRPTAGAYGAVPTRGPRRTELARWAGDRSDRAAAIKDALAAARASHDLVVIALAGQVGSEDSVPLLARANVVAVARSGVAASDGVSRFRRELDSQDARIAGIVGIGFDVGT